MEFGNAVKLCRTRRRLSQMDLAKRAKISVSYLSMLENDKRDPTLSVVQAIGVALDVPMWILFHLALDRDELAALDPRLSAELSRTALEVLSTPAAISF